MSRVLGRHFGRGSTWVGARSSRRIRRGVGGRRGRRGQSGQAGRSRRTGAVADVGRSVAGVCAVDRF